MKHEYNYQVWEMNNGGLALLVYENNAVVYARTGYELEHGVLSEDIGLLGSGVCNVEEWEENCINGLDLDEIYGPTSTLICKDGKAWPEEMGPNGIQELIKGKTLKFFSHDPVFFGTKHLKDASYLEDWLNETGTPDTDILSDVKIGGLDCGDMYAGDIMSLVE